jgi:Domain of Unknown Function (DUF748)
MELVAPLRKRPALLKWMMRAAIALIIYTLVGFFLVPPIIKWQMLKRLPAVAKRQATIKEVNCNPYALSLTIRGLALTEPDGTVFASFDELYVNFQLSSIFRWKWTFAEISLKKPFVQITYRQNRTFNFSNLLDSGPAPKGRPSPPPPVLVYQLSITNGTVAFTDLERQPAFQTQFVPIDLGLTNLTTVRDKKSPYSFIARTGEGESFAWSGTVTVNPLRSAGMLRLSGLKLVKYAPYARDYARFKIADGVVEVAADYRYDSRTNALDLNVSNAVIRLNKLKLQASDTDETFAAIPWVFVEQAQASLMHQTAQVGQFKSTGGFILARQNKDGTINLLSQLVTPPKKADAPASTNQAPAMPWTVKVDEVLLENYVLKVEDKKPTAPATLNIDQLGLRLKGVTTLSNAPVTASLSLRFQGTGAIGVEGTATLLPPAADMQVTVSNLDLRPIQPYVQEQAKVVITGGALNLKGHASYTPSKTGTPLVGFTGDLTVNDFRTTDDRLLKDFAKWKALAVDGIKLSLQPDHMEAQQAKFTGLDASVVIGPDKRPNFQRILLQEAAAAKPPPGAPAKPPTPAATPKPQAKAKLPDISLRTLALTNSSIHFSDQSLEPHCSFVVEDFGGTIRGLSSQPGTTAAVDVRGKVDAHSPFSVSGKVNPLADDLFADIAVTFTNTELTSFSPYTEKYAGRPLQKGKLSFAVHYLLEQKQLKAENGFYIDQLTLGPKNNSPDATSLPVKLAIALLKDREGRIQLDVPVAGKIDDPSFSPWPIIGHVVKNLLVKAATSPFALLGAAFGGGEELSYVEFQPGLSVLAESETNKLDKLAKALYERPALTVEISGTVDAIKDSEALAHVKVEEELKVQWLKEQTDANRTDANLWDISLDPKVRERLLRKLYRATIGSYRPSEPSLGTVPPPGTNAVASSTTITLWIPPRNAAYSRATSERGGGVSEHGASMLLAPPKPARAMEAAPRTPSGTTASGGQPARPGVTARDVELADMEDQLAKRVRITDDDLRDLIKARASQVQSDLLGTGKLTAERLFIIAPKPPSATSASGSRVNLSLD